MDNDVRKSRWEEQWLDTKEFNEKFNSYDVKIDNQKECD